jgi:hypothetical protein
MRLLVVGGIHGNEPLGIELVESLQRRPLPNVDALIANPKACREGRRYVEADMNRIFPGSPDGDSYESRQAHELRDRLTAGYDLVIDFHNTHAPGNDCGFLGDRGNRRLAAEAARSLGLSRAVIARYDCINRYLPNCLSVEISLGSPECRVDIWRSRLEALARARKENLNGLTLPLLYRFVQRVTMEQVEGVALSQGWEAFRTVPREDAQELGLEPGSRAIFVEDSYTPLNFAAIVEQIGLLAQRLPSAHPITGAA